MKDGSSALLPGPSGETRDMPQGHLPDPKTPRRGCTHIFPLPPSAEMWFSVTSRYSLPSSIIGCCLLGIIPWIPLSKWQGSELSPGTRGQDHTVGKPHSPAPEKSLFNTVTRALGLQEACTTLDFAAIPRGLVIKTGLWRLKGFG